MRRRRPRERPPLPRDTRYWHVDWYRGVRRALGGETRVELVLSRLKSRAPTYGSTPHTSRDHVEPDTQRVVPVSLDLFSRTSIGSVFCDGSRAESTRYLNYEPEGLEFSAETLRCVAADVALADDSGRLRYPLSGCEKGSWLVVDYKAAGVHVIIPMLEVLRFYYGTSAALLGLLLDQDFDQAFQAICDVGASGPDGDAGRCIVKLRPWMANADTQLVAALATSHIARTCTRMIFPSLILSYRLFGVAYPRVYPPFAGRPKCRLEGLWLDGEGKGSFLALHICRSSLAVSARDIVRIREARPARGRRTTGGTTQTPTAIQAMELQRALPDLQRYRFSDELPVLEPRDSPRRCQTKRLYQTKRPAVSVGLAALYVDYDPPARSRSTGRRPGTRLRRS